MYDLNALEVAAQLAAEVEGSAAVAITAGPASIDEAKLKKSALARGVDELFMTADDACAGMDAKATAAELAKLVAQIGDVDLVVCGDGSADNYAQQVDVQLACKLGWPVVNAATKVTCKGDVLEVERTLEDAVEVVEVALPAVVSVTPDAAEPRIPGMKDILAAGKKPMNVAGASDVAAAADRGRRLQGSRAGRPQARDLRRFRGRRYRQLRGRHQGRPVGPRVIKQKKGRVDTHEGIDHC